MDIVSLNDLTNIKFALAKASDAKENLLVPSEGCE